MGKPDYRLRSTCQRRSEWIQITYSLRRSRKVGVAIDTLEDMETMLDGIPLDRVSTSMTINSTAAILLAMVVSVGKKQGVPAEKSTEPCRTICSRSTSLAALTFILQSFRFGWSQTFLRIASPNFQTGIRFPSADTTFAKQAPPPSRNWHYFWERHYLLCRRPSTGTRFRFICSAAFLFFNTHNDFLEEISKFRAARRIWARIAKERFGAKIQDP